MALEYYENPEVSGRTFAERIGPAHESAAGVGHVILSFNYLAYEVATAFAKLWPIAPYVSELAPEELTFESQVKLLAFAVRALAPVALFNVGRDDPIESWDTIAGQCMRALAMRDEVLTLQSTELRWIPEGCAETEDHYRRRPWDGTKLLDMADFISNAACFVQEFFLICEYRAVAEP